MLLFFCRLPVVAAAGNRPCCLRAKVLVDKSPFQADTLRKQAPGAQDGFTEVFLKASFLKRSIA